VNAGPAGGAWLVTGGAGFIGSHLCEALAACGSAVVAVDDLSTGLAANLDRALASGRVEFIEGTVSAVLPALAGRRFDGVFHLAAAVGVRLVVEDPAAAAETNIRETMAALDFARRTGSPFLLASSSEVYGKGVRAPFGEDDDLVFGPPTVSRWSYGLSKAIDEHLALASGARDGLPVTVARLFNTVGPRQRGRFGMVLPRFVDAALAGEPLEVHGSGRQVRCFCDVRDVVGALRRMIDSPACRGRVLNVGSDRPVTIDDLAAAVLRVTGATGGIRRVPHSEVFGTAFEDLAIRVPDVSAIRAAIGFEPAIPLDTTIADVAASLAGIAGGRP
jgi:UDP-glucose 4-epimerase